VDHLVHASRTYQRCWRVRVRIVSCIVCRVACRVSRKAIKLGSQMGPYQGPGAPCGWWSSRKGGPPARQCHQWRSTTLGYKKTVSYAHYAHYARHTMAHDTMTHGGAHTMTHDTMTHGYTRKGDCSGSAEEVLVGALPLRLLAGPVLVEESHVDVLQKDDRILGRLDQPLHAGISRSVGQFVNVPWPAIIDAPCSRRSR
jgi:hypothetical protein